MEQQPGDGLVENSSESVHVRGTHAVVIPAAEGEPGTIDWSIVERGRVLIRTLLQRSVLPPTGPAEQ